MILRAKTFKAWFAANLRDSASDIANHGADCGYSGITYTSDAVKLFDKYGDEIWEMLRDSAESMGETIPKMIAGFRRVDMTDSLDSFKNLCVWFACEELARAHVERQDARD